MTLEFDKLTAQAETFATELLALGRLSERQRLILAYREGAIEQIKLDTEAIKLARMELPDARHSPV